MARKQAAGAHTGQQAGTSTPWTRAHASNLHWGMCGRGTSAEASGKGREGLARKKKGSDSEEAFKRGCTKHSHPYG